MHLVRTNYNMVDVFPENIVFAGFLADNFYTGRSRVGVGARARVRFYGVLSKIPCPNTGTTRHRQKKTLFPYFILHVSSHASHRRLIVFVCDYSYRKGGSPLRRSTAPTTDRISGPPEPFRCRANSYANPSRPQLFRTPEKPKTRCLWTSDAHTQWRS